MSKTTTKLNYSMAEAAKLADCSTDTIRRLISRGELKAYRLGKSDVIRIRATDLQKLWRPVTPLAEVVA